MAACALKGEGREHSHYHLGGGNEHLGEHRDWPVREVVVCSRWVEECDHRLPADSLQGCMGDSCCCSYLRAGLAVEGNSLSEENIVDRRRLEVQGCNFQWNRPNLLDLQMFRDGSLLPSALCTYVVVLFQPSFSLAVSQPREQLYQLHQRLQQFLLLCVCDSCFGFYLNANVVVCHPKKMRSFDVDVYGLLDLHNRVIDGSTDDRYIWDHHRTLQGLRHQLCFRVYRNVPT